MTIRHDSIKVGDLVRFSEEDESSFLERDMLFVLVLSVTPVSPVHTQFVGLDLETMEKRDLGIVESTQKYWKLISRAP